ncbi:hypothetical protein BGP77_09240 [Saccharospirillum sp. MSK14-1]|uniref:YkgJ family cysteine cluster protein n=1 Tax=Saccharospirillum sp. MSK14-1 TaxID=1897632 RepID=UPI000D3CB873|nr:YkgJ family cysteine cluster protein [Saccharospirillum sp. MSK14-1]PTY38931.1 hypothetical protein BGP77_09240 [Saccharospirillum sp. MSK14-1]
MECRSGCGACCIAPSINTPYYGMPDGKPAGVRCTHLLPDYRCGIFGQPERPAACAAFQAEPDFCGRDRVEALRILTQLEADSSP